MKDYVVAIIALLVGFLAVAILAFLCFFLVRHIRSTRRRKPERKTSISVFDRKNSSGFSTKSGYFDADASPRVAHKEYLDFNAIESILPSNIRGTNDGGRYYSQENPVYKENTARRHRTSRSQQRSFDSDETGSTHVSKESLPGAQALPTRTHISVIEERPFGPVTTHVFEPVREIFRENHISYRRDDK